MTTTISKSKFRFLPAIALFATMTAPAAAQTASEITEMDRAMRETIATVAIEESLACWARGMDLTLGGDAEAALTAWNDCYAHPDYTFRVFFQGQTQEGQGAAGRAQNNVQTGGMFGYVGASHFISNVEIDMADENTATATALQTADHFREDGVMERTYGVITVDFARSDDGRWLATDETMNIERMLGFTTQPAPIAMMQ